MGLCCNLGVTHFGNICYLPLTSEPCGIDVVAHRALHDVRPEFFQFRLARNLLHYYGFCSQFPQKKLLEQGVPVVADTEYGQVKLNMQLAESSVQFHLPEGKNSIHISCPVRVLHGMLSSSLFSSAWCWEVLNKSYSSPEWLHCKTFRKHNIVNPKHFSGNHSSSSLGASHASGYVAFEQLNESE
ncbi:unnamed protein product [Darwinula stevensoni]|uniref:Uncharacterized protein n=1 Tax=Darwinula stevensoni TaxID=69355 RepID=A0A7R8X344_9CRUS|nr:unnamed protein product [Darwinula stevensoni]CAG0884601.1 unnamed protein product [Darwinula stevensoni]